MAIRFSLDRSLSAPPAVVWDTLTALDDAGRWMGNLEGIERLGPPPLVEGSRWMALRGTLGRDSGEVFEVTGLDPMRRLDLVSDGRRSILGGGEFRYRFLLTPLGLGARLTFSAQLNGFGWLIDRASLLLARPFRQSVEDDFRALVANCERAMA